MKISHEDALEEYKVIMGMIDETEAKAKLMIFRIEDGQVITEEEVQSIERDTVSYLLRLAKLEMTLAKTG